jgi:hypothetical protein
VIRYADFLLGLKPLSLSTVLALSSTNCKAIHVRWLLSAIKFTCGRFFAELSQ